MAIALAALIDRVLGEQRRTQPSVPSGPPVADCCMAVASPLHSVIRAVAERGPFVAQSKAIYE